MITAFGATDKGCVRANNEDTFLVAPDLGLYLVADGMGGAAAGEKASHLAAETLREVMHEVRDEGMNTAKLVSACHEANRRVKAAANQNSSLEGMGTTLVVAVDPPPDGAGGDKKDEPLLLASVGDSRAYRFDAGVLQQITDDQSWINEVGRRLGLAEETLKVHPMRHVLTMAIGVSDQLKVNSYAVPMKPETIVLLCSDGLHGVVTNQEITDVLNRRGPIEQSVQLLIDTARAHGAPDNVSVVILKKS
jgi:PPM family protein phosphatase